VLPDPLVLQETLVLMVPPEHKVLQDLAGHPVQLEQVEVLDRRVPRARRDPQDLWVHPELRDPRGLLEDLELSEWLDLPDSREQLEVLECLDQWVLLDRPDLKEL